MIPYEALSEIPGWFDVEDWQLFHTIGDVQRELRGAILEIGAYCGKSAVILGALQRVNGDAFYVVDPFEMQLDDVTNTVENAEWYGNLSRAKFEEHYQRFHPTLPRILQCASSTLSKDCFQQDVRLAHLDGSHLYRNVLSDIHFTCRLLHQQRGVVIVDDYRSQHTPGVAAAIWRAVDVKFFVPFALTYRKLYLTRPRAVPEYGEAVWKAAELMGRRVRMHEIFDYQIVQVLREDA